MRIQRLYNQLNTELNSHLSLRHRHHRSPQLGAQPWFLAGKLLLIFLLCSVEREFVFAEVAVV